MKLPPDLSQYGLAAAPGRLRAAPVAVALVAHGRAAWERVPVEPARPGLVSAVAVALALVLADVLGFVSAPLTSSMVHDYAVQPLAWLLPAMVVLLVMLHRREALPDPRPLLGIAVVIGGLQVAGSLVLGLAFHYGRSPLHHDPVHVGLGVLYLGAVLSGRELGRWHLARVLQPRSGLMAVVIPWLLLAVMAVPLARIQSATSLQSQIELLGGAALPAAGASLFATQLALQRGPLASLAFMAVLEGFTWFAPILPELPWAAGGAVGLLVPAMGALYLDRAPAVRRRAAAVRQQQGSKLHWAALGLLALAMLWFNFGFLGYKPLVVDGRSMEPNLHTGDVVLVSQTPPGQLRVGDVIQFRHGGIEVVHRIVASGSRAGHPWFVTKGDNNRVRDPSIDAGQVAGRVVFTAPRVGWPLLLTKVVAATILDVLRRHAVH